MLQDDDHSICGHTMRPNKLEVGQGFADVSRGEVGKGRGPLAIVIIVVVRDRLEVEVTHLSFVGIEVGSSGYQLPANQLAAQLYIESAQQQINARVGGGV